MLNCTEKLTISKTANVHHTAVLQGNITVEDNVTIGPYCVLDGNIKLHEGVKLSSHVVILGNTTIGEGTSIHSFASIGSIPQDVKYGKEESFTEIGKNNTIREHVTINSGTAHGGLYTRIGDDNLLMISCHIGHDSQVANNCIIANNVALGGHVILENNVIIGGNSAIHQFVRVGAKSMVGGMSGVNADILPFCLYIGTRENKIKRLNIVGLKRHGFSNKEIKEIESIYNFIFSNNSLLDNVKSIYDKHKENENIKNILDFILSNQNRSMCIWDGE